MKPILHLCATCRPDTETSALRAALGDTADLRLHDCLNVCNRPTALSIQGNGTAYLFADVDPETDADDIAATVRTYANAPSGNINDARPCGRLRHCLIGKIPAA
ncbi:hypothetical protein PARPLA_00702 [Rhodobacteraceae bacterium THAF1]|uniref:DUF1636 family protein n=1 Tax=Palleronia sp. THAF1 TaxID=2587842 RepID=UPI000F3EE6E3|nr:DUF1636 family protein [Palleronia sp. THAF1]QFU09735.1 hypothetical protein FIU81_13750 [Palleronia sp. THAF1]VDC17362.1 hypothetical protein PARPLA_00702 [Rhodobacteraceae bacterium THAF1]